ncbi:Doublecortin domain-containing protein, partial [Trichostrongylus colubriformis]
IRVYKNGEERDPGKLITITRREYKHWIVFLDALTRKLGTTTAINRLYTTHGVRVEHFNELEHNGEYVAVERGPFIECNYGAYRVWTQTERKWTSLVRVAEGKPIFLDSGDSMDLYLKKQGYGSTTGLPYPLDGLSKSPNVTAAQMSGFSNEK